MAHHSDCSMMMRTKACFLCLLLPFLWTTVITADSSPADQQHPPRSASVGVRSAAVVDDHPIRNHEEADDDEDDNGALVNTPCNVPNMDDPKFPLRCFTSYLKKPYVCDPDQSISETEIKRIHEDILKPAEFYHYCLPCVKPRTCPFPKFAMVSNKTDREAVAIEELKKMKRRNNSGENSALFLSLAAAADDDPDRPRVMALEEYIDRYIRKKKNVPPVFIAINVYAKFVHPRTLNGVKKHFPCALRLLTNLSLDDADERRVTNGHMLDAYGTISSERWSSNLCSPNLTVLLFTGETIEYEADRGESSSATATYRTPRLHVNHTFVNQTWLVGKMQELIDELNSDNSSSMSSRGFEKLYKFLDRFTRLYEEAHSRRGHHIPVWAAVTFGVCAILSVCAVLIGNLVTSADRRGNRKMKQANKGQGKRKWRAGFSGGMWASV